MEYNVYYVEHHNNAPYDSYTTELLVSRIWANDEKQALKLGAKDLKKKGYRLTTRDSHFGDSCIVSTLRVEERRAK